MEAVARVDIDLLDLLSWRKVSFVAHGINVLVTARRKLGMNKL